MEIALHDADQTTFPNLALMKLSARHRQRGDRVGWYEPLRAAEYDRVYSSKVFTFTEDDRYLRPDAKRGGTGYRCVESLTDEVEHIKPDYDLYGISYSIGFLTRGCPRKCPWCVVPKKEGGIRPHAELDEFLSHDTAVLMDNNVLACDHGIEQIEKIAAKGVKVDFNQGLDARLIDDAVAKLLSRVRWLKPIRLACDSIGQMPAVQKAVTLLRWHNATPTNYFVYCLVKDIDDAVERVQFLKGMALDPFAQPFIDYESGTEPTKEQRDFARWVNHKAIFRTVAWDEYRTGKRGAYAVAQEVLDL